MFKTPQDYFDQATKYFNAFPKTLDEVKSVTEKVTRVYETEANNVKDAIAIYNKAARGDASVNEITKANQKAQEAMIAARFAAVMALPGAIFALPIMIEASKEYGFEFVPESVSKEFNI